MRIRWVGAVFGVMVLLSASLAEAETVHFRSGDGSGSRDYLTSFLLGPYNTDFGKPLGALDFSKAQTGPPAFINTSPFWITNLASDPAARWIGPSATAGYQGNTALYAQSFQIQNAFSAATLTLHYAVDDALGGI